MEPSSTQQPRKVLIIEDENFISELYVRALKRAGYDATVEIDGQKGLEMAKSDEYDIILLDLSDRILLANMRFQGRHGCTVCK